MQKTLSHLTRQTLRLVTFLSFLLFFAVTPACKQRVDSLPSGSSQSPSTQTPQDQISASLSQKRRTISPKFMCFNINAVRVKSWQDPGFIAAVERLSPQVIRIPGGEVASYWDWQRGGLKQDLEGLPDGLPPFLRYRDRNYTASKLEDFKAGFEATGTTPLFVLNMLSSTLDSELKMLKQAQQLGMPIQEIELGNEFFFPTKNYRAVFPNPQKYAQTATQWAAKIKQVFPQARISIVGVESKGHKGGFRRSNWNRLVLPSGLQNAEAATLHIYTKQGLGPELRASNQPYPFFNEQDVSTILGEPFRHWQNLRKANGFRSVPSDKKIWITEYNLMERVSNKKNGPKPRVIGSWAHGLHTLALSLLFLEEPQVEKICNHMLVGNSQFAAIYANDKSFINPSDPTVKSTPFGLSATGSSLSFLGQALKQATVAQQIDFQGNPTLTGKEQFSYPALYGWVFSDQQGNKRAIVMNLSRQALRTDLTAIFPANIVFKQLAGPPRTLVTGPDVLDEKMGRTTGVLSLPAYSTTLLSD